jgi:hypothetical protein
MFLLRIHPTRWNQKCCQSTRFLEPPALQVRQRASSACVLGRGTGRHSPACSARHLGGDSSQRLTLQIGIVTIACNVALVLGSETCRHQDRCRLSALLRTTDAKRENLFQQVPRGRVCDPLDNARVFRLELHLVLRMVRADCHALRTLCSLWPRASFLTAEAAWITLKTKRWPRSVNGDLLLFESPRLLTQDVVRHDHPRFATPVKLESSQSEPGPMRS